MLTPPSPQFPKLPRTDDPPGNDPEREPRREPEPDVGEPERSLQPTRLAGRYAPAPALTLKNQALPSPARRRAMNRSQSLRKDSKSALSWSLCVSTSP
jgi:hypothetical protein